MEKLNGILKSAARLLRGKLSPTQKNTLYRICASAVLFIVALFLNELWVAKLIVCLVSWAICAWDVLVAAYKRARHGNVFEEHMLMSVASVGAFILGEFSEGCAVMILYQLGELFQSIAVGRSRHSIKAMMELRPDMAHKLVGDEIVDVDTSELEVGDVCVVRPGERVPVDGIVIDGVLEADASAITGESLPVTITDGGEVTSGYINLSSIVRVKASSNDADSTVSRILRIVEEQSENKSENEKLVTRFAKYYTPAVFALTLIIGIVVPIFTHDFRTWIYRALSLLVISCPCAFVISVPLTYFGGIGGASSRGVLIKGGSVIDELSRCDTLMLDKTGTLTTGKLHITSVCPAAGANEQVLLTVAQISEGGSNHPIAKAVYEYASMVGEQAEDAEQFTELAGKGTAALCKGHLFFAGEKGYISELGIDIPDAEDESEKRVYFALDKTYVGYIAMSDRIKPEAEDAIRAARSMGIKRVGMFSGDRKAIAERTASELGLDICRAQLKPEDKLELVRELKDGGAVVLFAGDGINDAPTLAEANVGAAMGDIGSDAALEAADVVIMDGRLEKLAQAIGISKYTIAIVKQNICLTMGIKLLVLLLTVLGIGNMTLAIFADVGVAILAILNAMRALDPTIE